MNGEIITITTHELYVKREEFIAYLDVSKETLKTYSEGIKCFFNYLETNNIKNPSRLDFRQFRDELKAKATINTVNSYLTAIRRFFRYLETNKYYSNITSDVKSIKVSKIPKKQVLSLELSKHIYESLTDLREKCLFSLAITTGLRGIEMARAKIEDIKDYNGYKVLWVQCKKHDDKDEYVKLSSQTIKDIEAYIGNRTIGYIFVSESNRNKGGGVTTKTLRLEIKRIFKKFGLDDDTFSLHSMRRSCATIAYNQGSDIYSLQQLLHHHSISTTQRYINQSVRDNNMIEYKISNVVLN